MKGAQLFFGNKRPKEANVGVTSKFLVYELPLGVLTI